MKPTRDAIAECYADAAQRSANPEGITVEVLTDDPIVAEAVGPMLAARLFPDRMFGLVLFMERTDAGTYDVTVHDRGAKCAHTKGGPPPTR